MSDAFIRVQDLHLTLPSDAGPVDILRGISLSVKPGEALGLVGPSGSGKSTLLMVMAGLERASSGSIRIGEHDLSKMGEDELALFRRRQVGIVFQSFHLIPTMSALENVAIPLELAGDPRAFARAADELAAVGLGARIKHYPGQLSGGEQQRVALARALVHQPQLLLADEPTGNLDGATGQDIVELMFSLQAERGATMVLITHDAGLAERADRVIRLRDGRIEGEAPGTRRRLRAGDAA